MKELNIPDKSFGGKTSQGSPLKREHQELELALQHKTKLRVYLKVQ